MNRCFPKEFGRENRQTLDYQNSLQLKFHKVVHCDSMLLLSKFHGHSRAISEHIEYHPIFFEGRCNSNKRSNSDLFMTISLM